MYVDNGPRSCWPTRTKAAETLDFSRPVGVMLFGILHFFSNADDPRGPIGELLKPLPAGSGLAPSHLASDLHPEEMAETFNRLNSRTAESVTLRSHDKVAALLTGLDLVEPGAVQTARWRPDPGASTPPAQVWIGVGTRMVTWFECVPEPLA